MFHLARRSAELIGVLSLALAPVFAAADEKPIDVGDDPQAIVLTWNVRRADLPRTKPEPNLVIRANGAVAVAQPHGGGKLVESQISADQLQKLLSTAIHEQRVFDIQPSALEEHLRAARIKAGMTSESGGRLVTSLMIAANGNRHELRCDDLDEQPADCAEVARLQAIERHLERLVAWAYAGGDDGVAAALKLANDELQRNSPDAPRFVAGDLAQAIKRTNGTSEIVFEHRGVAADKNPFSFIHAVVARDIPEADARVTVRAALATAEVDPAQREQVRQGPFKLEPPPVASDRSINFDYPIVYIRSPRDPENLPQFANTHPPTVMPPGTEMVILHPDGREEVLVEAGEKEAIIDPYVSFDGEWVYYVKMHDVSDHPRESRAGSDIYKIRVATREIVQLTRREGFTANPPISARAHELDLKHRGVFNLGPCPLPGGRVVFTSDRNAFRAAPAGTHHRLALQLFVMDDDGRNVETIGHLNLGGVQHPQVLKDGRIIFTTNETQGTRGGYFFWGVWSIHPDGANWDPLISAYDGDVFHFYTQLSDERVVVNNYYPGGTTRGFGTYHTLPPRAPVGKAFGPAYQDDPRNQTGPTIHRMSFTPYRFEALTLFALKDDVRPNHAFGKVTHPSGAPDNHLLTCWGTTAIPKDAVEPPGGYGNSAPNTAFDSGIYLIKSGKPINEPGEMLLVKNDPEYHELQPRALVTYERIYGVREPKQLGPVRNDGKLTKRLPAGVPYGLVGTSSLYKRESFPSGIVPAGKVTAEFNVKSGSTLFRNLGFVYYNSGRNWLNQGADAGIYSNSDIHAIRIVVTEPVTHYGNEHTPLRGLATNFQSPNPQHAPAERLRILGEFPVRKFDGDKQPIDPDGHPDTSFEAKIPADIAWTFQTLDKRGMVLNMAQTWHQIRPGERRNNCGGCHAHSQKPTDFNLTAAARRDYEPWDLTGDRRPLLTTKASDESGRKWDIADESGVRFTDSVLSVEYLRDVKPIFERSCVACHTKQAENPPAKLVLDADDELINGVPGTYYRLAMDVRAQFGLKPLAEDWGGYTQVTRYVRKMQSRRSLLAWKIFGERLDGWTNDDHPTETVTGDANTIFHNGQPLPNDRRTIEISDIDYEGSIMPPPEAVAAGKVKALSDEDRRTLVRWIDLGCPLDLDYDPANPQERGKGWMLDEGRPTLALAEPRAGRSREPLARILVGMHDYFTGIDPDSFTITADFELDGVTAGRNLANKFVSRGDGVWELRLARPIAELPQGVLKVSVKDHEGNITRIERTFRIVP